jgi:2-succinyl-6-hydroxy-2,4-cyclohexadiene-1-carboxylate synthase
LSGKSETAVLLHGFGGTRRAWDGVIERLPPEPYRPLALDLPGHGEYADATPPISFAGCVEHVLARAPERFALCGYSLGGRIALHVALTAPERVSRLVLVSTTAGIVWPTSWNTRRSRTSSSAGAPSRCSPTSPPGSAPVPAKTSAATDRTLSPRSCEE